MAAINEINHETMTEKELQTYLLKRFPKEDSGCDWKEMKNLKNSFANDPHKDVISYLSGISNMEGGHLVIGVKDGTLDIVGTDLSKFNFDSTSVIYKMIEMCPNLPSEGLFVEEFVTSDTGKTVWIINIPKHLPRRPVLAHKKKWQRIGDSLVELTAERENVILNEEIVHYDWSAEVVEDADYDDLDEEAIKKALEGYCERYPKRAQEACNWSIETFLDKAKVTKNGKITRTALLPSPVPKYDQRSLLEALHNCIMHQDYTKKERIVVTETADSVRFQNAGSFYEGCYSDYIEGEKTPTRYRNEFLKTAMLNLNMVDSQGFGIHDMYEHQRNRFLPMPDYESSTDTHVVLVIPGQVLNVEYSTVLMEHSNLDLTTVFLLDRVQRNKPISKEARTKLRELNLIEGRHPHIIISRKVAQLTDMEAEYSDLKGFDDDYYRDLILKSISDHKKLRRSKIDKLLYGKLPAALDDRQKKNHIDYLLKSLRKAGKIHVGDNKNWEIGPGIDRY